MKVLFLNPPFNLVTEENGTSNYSSLGDRVMPYALLTGASYFRNRGFEVLFFDGSLYRNPELMLEHFITQNTPDILITTLNCLAAPQTERLIAQLKKKAPFFSILWCNEPFIEELASIIACGDSFVYNDWIAASFELCEVLSKPSNPDSVSGVFLRKHKTIAFTGNRCRTPVSVYPPPAVDIVNTRKYNHQQIMLSEGCNFHCSFCHFGNRIDGGWHSKSVEQCIKELKKLRECGKRFIRVIDNELTTKKDFVKTLLKSIIEEKLDIVWEANVRVSNIDEEIVSLMSRAGCLQVGFGVESGVQEILDLNKKEITLSQIKNAARLFKNYHILTRAYFLIGLLGDTPETVRKTSEFVINEIQPDSAGLGIVIPYQGTEYHAILKSSGLLNDVSLRHVLWIYKNVYDYMFIDNRFVEKPDWKYEHFTFDKIVNTYRDISKRVSDASLFHTLSLLLRRDVKLVRFFVSQCISNPVGIVQRLIR